MKNQIKNTFWAVLAVASISMFNSCEDFEQYEPLGSNSIADATPPSASFSYSQGAGTGDIWKTYTFANGSTSATTYAWDFGDGNTSTDVDAVNTYPGEGTFTVTLTASDDLGVESTTSQEIVIVEPEEPLVPDPVLVNADFDKLPKSSGSDCSCSGWINKSIGDQGESSSGNGGSNNVLKYDNNEPDITYQEFEVVPNADYTISLVTSFKGSEGGMYPSVLEVRVLAGSGYIDGYSATYYSQTVDFPQDDYGYTTIAQVEDPANNLLVETINNPNNEDYNTTTYTFNAGANNSVALYIRGIGGPSTGGGGGDFGFNSGDEEIRIDTVTIVANN
ncbi:PKD domain-containing protein [Winogradskyella sp. PC D3.3]